MNLTKQELDILISLAKRVMWDKPEVRAKLQKEMVNIVPCNFYSQTPSIEEIEQSFEYRNPDQPVYEKLFDHDSMSEFCELLKPYALEFNPPVEGDLKEPKGYFWNNPAFSHLDAMVYYCMIRYFKPNKILEIGSGFSTLVANEAIKKNGFGEVISIEPFPMPFLTSIECVTQIIEKKVQDIPVSELVELIEDVDLWFIDSTHTVKIGSDCLYIYLKVMPEIQSPTLVHTHDITLPQGMNRQKALEKQIYWTEQYLLYAYLLDNHKADVVFGSNYCYLYMSGIAEKLMNDRWNSYGGSIWYTLNMNNQER